MTDGLGTGSDEAREPAAPAGLFHTTHWSVVLALKQGDPAQVDAALEWLCRTYWYPLYAYTRRRGHTVEDAQDLTQEFFARLLQRDFLRNVAREKGRFRTFLLVSLKNFLSTEWRRSQTAKRGGGQGLISWDEIQAEERYALEPVSEMTPDLLYEHRWAVTVMEQAMARLRSEFQREGKGRQFDEFKVYLSAEATKSEYEASGGRLGMTGGAVAVAVHRLRQRYSQLVRAVVAETVSGPGDVEDELKVLARALQSAS